ncbi:cyclic di-GMP phosphodiesterase [Sideroxyarcus emersonii]|uniref:Cyclic di-GMP phosphodiesterase n=1 Tax=Sideroxyarcus emersonii TaxID=2764705 RepID=A0AAN1X931_9PROT|nr:HD domain-containing phosphohydrolase [Sideroxyarcus emersonii]BCK87060.1 cyclic di-GMP phosphodiesterase [Sideroxyarcus emersonii]
MEQADPAVNALYTYTKALSVALGYRDRLTQLHSERVQVLSAAIGTACGLSSSELLALRIAASFHDIGKIGIPDHILLKPTQFDDAEWEVMKTHTEIGEKIMAATALEGADHAARIIRHHHEHYDGSGYPDGLAGTGIPICARIISIADSYDAMAVTRSYHHARAHPEIMAILHQETGEKHDPALMQIFSEHIETSEFRAGRS